MWQNRFHQEVLSRERHSSVELGLTPNARTSRGIQQRDRVRGSVDGKFLRGGLKGGGTLAELTQQVSCWRNIGVIRYHLGVLIMKLLTGKNKPAWGQNENSSPADSTSDGFCETAPKSWGKDQYKCDFHEGSTCNQAHIFSKVSVSVVKITASHKKQTSP